MISFIFLMKLKSSWNPKFNRQFDHTVQASYTFLFHKKSRSLCCRFHIKSKSFLIIVITKFKVSWVFLLWNGGLVTETKVEERSVKNAVRSFLFSVVRKTRAIKPGELKPTQTKCLAHQILQWIIQGLESVTEPWRKRDNSGNCGITMKSWCWPGDWSYSFRNSGASGEGEGAGRGLAKIILKRLIKQVLRFNLSIPSVRPPDVELFRKLQIIMVLQHKKMSSN